MVAGVEKVTLVHSFAPARQSSSYGTTSPQIFRPFTAGLDQATVTSVMPTVCFTVAAGLGRGRTSFGASWAPAEVVAASTAATRRARRVLGSMGSPGVR